MKSGSDPKSGDDPKVSKAGARRGRELFNTLGCMGCHRVNGQGGTAGPDLSNEGDKGRSRAWLIKQIRNPRANDPQTFMPAYDNLSNNKVSDLVDYLQGLSTSNAGSGDGGRMPAEGKKDGQTMSSDVSASVTASGKMWTEKCGRCHNLRPPSEYSDAQWMTAVFHMRVRVPLTGEEQEKILEFLKAAN